MTQTKANMSASIIMTSKNNSENRMFRILISVAIAAGALTAATKGSDTTGYTATDATVFSYVDISGGGGAAVLSGTDDGTAALTLPFSFNFYGTNYTIVCPSSNGAIYFVPNANTCNSVSADFANVDLSVATTPLDLPAALPFWTDLTFQVPGAGAVYYQTIGAAPNRRFVVQWSNAYPSSSPNPVNFQVILTETSNTIAFQYQTVDLGTGNVYTKGSLSTVGIRNNGAPGNGEQIQWSFDVPVLANSYALLFTPPTAAPPAGGTGGTGGGVGGVTGNLTVAPSLTFNVPVGSVVTQQFAVTYITGAAFTPILQATASTSDGGNWLTISPSAAAAMTLASSSNGVYTYKATLNISASGVGYGNGNTLNGAINFSVSGATATTNVISKLTAPARFTTAPTALTFTYRIGDAATPNAQTLNVSSTATGTNFTASASTSSGGNWLAAAPTSGTAPGAISISVNITGLGVGTYSGKVTIGSGGSTLDVPVTLNYLSSSSITITKNGIVPLYSSSTAIQAGSWISIYGTNLADAAATWNGDFPTTLGGVSVTVDGKPGYLWYVSPTQINLQAPDDTASGSVTVVVTNSHGSSTSTVTLAPASPSFSLLDSSHVAAVVPTPNGSGAYGGGTYDIVGPIGAFSYTTRPVKGGETLELFGVGFGPTSPPVAAGQVFTGVAPTVSPVTVSIGGANANVSFAGLTSAGLYQINVTIPTGLPSGDQAVQATVNGNVTLTGPVVTVQ
jgi:uncharacterized protein (TIGR03437 family)